MEKKLICFLCTGNYYRSRYAEEYFNHRAAKRGLSWRAESRALHQDLSAVTNLGPMSIVAIAMLALKGIIPKQGSRLPQTLLPEEIPSYKLIIALNGEEHAALVNAYYPQIRGSVQYWDVKDLGEESPGRAVGKIDRYVHQLIDSLGR